MQVQIYNFLGFYLTLSCTYLATGALAEEQSKVDTKNSKDFKTDLSFDYSLYPGDLGVGLSHKLEDGQRIRLQYREGSYQSLFTNRFRDSIGRYSLTYELALSKRSYFGFGPEFQHQRLGPQGLPGSIPVESVVNSENEKTSHRFLLGLHTYLGTRWQFANRFLIAADWLGGTMGRQLVLKRSLYHSANRLDRPFADRFFGVLHLRFGVSF